MDFLFPESNLHRILLGLCHHTSLAFVCIWLSGICVRCTCIWDLIDFFPKLWLRRNLFNIIWFITNWTNSSICHALRVILTTCVSFSIINHINWLACWFTEALLFAFFCDITFSLLWKIVNLCDICGSTCWVTIVQYHFVRHFLCILIFNY